MTPKQVQEGLQELGRSFGPILHDSANQVLDEAEARLYPFLGQRGGRRRGGIPQKWGYAINADNPLRFRSTMVDELRTELWVDVYCLIEWEEENAPPTSQEIKIRAWSNDSVFLHDFERRAIEGAADVDQSIQEVIDRMTGDPDSGRVIYRCHFDKANNGQSGPKYHVQFGGAPRAGESGFLPEVIDLPRIVQPPLDLILTCELVALNFYPREYLDIRKNPTWRSVLFESQKNLLERYYEDCWQALRQFEARQTGSLLERLWNVPLA